MVILICSELIGVYTCYKEVPNNEERKTGTVSPKVVDNYLNHDIITNL